MKNTDSFKILEWILRVTVFMTFLGHGIVAIGKNANWLVYLETVGFSVKISSQLILLIGISDILVAIFMIIKPYRYIVLWAVIWAFSTALIRPISGEPIWAFVERGANWGVPLVLFLLLQMKLKKKINQKMI